MWFTIIITIVCVLAILYLEKLIYRYYKQKPIKDENGKIIKNLSIIKFKLDDHSQERQHIQQIATSFILASIPFYISNEKSIGNVLIIVGFVLLIQGKWYDLKASRYSYWYQKLSKS